MSRDTEAVELAAKYRQVIRFAAAREWRKWSHHPSSERPFDAVELDQWALEAILIMGGLMKSGRRLQTLAECSGNPSWIQRNVDYYVKDKVHKACRASRVTGRTADVYLDEPVSDNGTSELTRGDKILANQDDTNPDSITDVSGRFPLLYAQNIMGEKQAETIRRLRIGSKTFLALREAEMRDFHAWAVRNHRIKPGTEIPSKRGSGPGRWTAQVASAV